MPSVTLPLEPPPANPVPAATPVMVPFPVAAVLCVVPSGNLMELEDKAQLDVGLPLTSMLVTSRNPPVARTANSFAAAELKLKAFASENRNEPPCAPPIFALRPAAKLKSPPAVLAAPPG